jgi:hypothetical protein
MQTEHKPTALEGERQDESKLAAPISLAADQLEAVAAGTAAFLRPGFPGPVNGYAAF